MPLKPSEPVPDDADQRSPALQSALFPPLGAEGRVEAVVRRLGEAIALGLVEAGERLPPEAELAARFEVAPVTLREALAILRQAGLIETRRGRAGGTFVRQDADRPNRSAIPTSLGDYSPAGVRDLGDFGKTIAGAAAALAAERASASEIAQMRLLVKRMREAGSLVDFLRSDGRFHIEVAAASQSARLTQAEIDVQSEHNVLLSLLPDRRSILVRANREHAALVDAIEARDAAAATAVAVEHSERMTDLVLGLSMLAD
jgi:DNA-binding FadR family transcriptional regulator